MKPSKPRLLSALHLLCSAITLLSVGGSLPIRAQNLAGDEALSKVLIDGEDWQLVAEGFGFTDAACSDAEGNFYFSDLPKGSLYRVDASERGRPRPQVWIEKAPKISGMKFGPEGRLYAATQGTIGGPSDEKKKIVAIDPSTKQIIDIATDVQPNDLVVSKAGWVYFTVTGKGQVTIVDTKGNLRVGAIGINKPNGITLSPDQGTLAVSEYGGTNVWIYRVGRDGSLTAGERYMTLRTPVGKTDSGGDGMTTDATGRYYVTSHVGVQMFDSTGRLGGVIARPQDKATVSVTFAGPNLEYLYVCSSDRIYRRKTKAKGVSFSRLPLL
jgi:enterochelin esterase family protein